MKKIISLVLAAVLLVGVVVGAKLIYDDYMEKNQPSNIVIVGKPEKPNKPIKNETERGTAINGDPSDTEAKTYESDSDEAITTESEYIGEGSTESSYASGDVTDPGAEESSGDTTVDGGENGSITETESDSEPAEETEKDAEKVTEKETEEETETEYVSPYLAADFTVYDINGNPVKLSDFRGKPIVLNFWASDCYYCVQEMPDFQKAYEKYGDEVVFLMVAHVKFANRSPSYEQNFIDKKGYTFPIVFDTKMDAVYTYGVSGIPQTFFIDRNFDLYTYIPGMATAEALETCIGWILE